ncbi:hypothetical protein [Pseudoroseomonas cervicalis]|uniref:hypothetical protein n=1 Tax=Teichococcus cervicalis TaxID=204525 RepID=UPI0022F1C886|nr:hypothetical protein [Pseudoroseomonas cervicalis]WBV44963.1 hypothetical protein PFY06_17810 [Pseudoroseomonas cervicalis]
MSGAASPWAPSRATPHAASTGPQALPPGPSAGLPAPEVAMVTGRVLHCVDIPALDLPGYRLLQGLMLEGPTRQARGGWLRWLAFILAGGLAGLGAAHLGLTAEFWAATRGGQGLVLGGRGVFIAAVALLATGALLVTLRMLRSQGRVLAALHRSAPRLLGPHRLCLGEHGLALTTPRQIFAARWEMLAPARRLGAWVFLLADNSIAFWLPHRLLAEHPEGPAIRALLAARIGLGKGV